MACLVFGATGQVARELALIMPDAKFLSRAEVDLRKPGACKQAIGNYEPSFVINAAAWTAVDAAEDAERDAFKVNAEAPGVIARACADQGIPFVHISTDYVFDGSGTTPRTTVDPTMPLGVYGASKLAGEEAVRDAKGVYSILRTSWVFSAHGTNFVKTMLGLSETRDRLSIVADQVGGPTPASGIATAAVEMAHQLATASEKTGTYHYAGAPDVSWAEFARTIFNLAGRVVEVVDIPSSDYPTLAPRPLNSRLDCTETEIVFGIQRPDWRTSLATVLRSLEG